MVTGFPPFHNDNRMKLFEAIAYKSADLSKVAMLPYPVFAEVAGPSQATAQQRSHE
jgi:hypothetical protein